MPVATVRQVQCTLSYTTDLAECIPAGQGCKSNYVRCSKSTCMHVYSWQAREAIL